MLCRRSVFQRPIHCVTEVRQKFIGMRTGSIGRRHNRFRAMIHVLIASVIGLAGVNAAQGASDSLQLEAQFARAKDLRIVHSLMDLPVDVTARLRAFTQGRKVAELGEPWMSLREPEDPFSTAVAQHLFSGVSDSMFFVLLQAAQSDWGARNANVKLLVGFRDAPTFCSYAYDRMELGSLRLDSLQQDFERLARTRDDNKQPACTLQHLPR